jgi:hypothetical protein
MFRFGCGILCDWRCLDQSWQRMSDMSTKRQDKRGNISKQVTVLLPWLVADSTLCSLRVIGKAAELN